MENKKEMGNIKMISIMSLIAILGIGATKIYVEYFGEPKLSNDENNQVAVFHYCKKQILKKLKSPVSAIFEEKIPKMKKTKNNYWSFYSYVDSQNSYGAIIRSNYLCKASCYIKDKERDNDICLAITADIVTDNMKH